VAVETIAGEAVSEQTPDSQEVTVIRVVFSSDSNLLTVVNSVAERGHHVVYSVVIPLMVVVAVETTALETVFEQLFDSQELTVIKVVCSFVEGVSEVILYTVVRSRENPEEVSSLVTLPVSGDVADEEGITLALFSDDMVSLEEFVLSV
jgi:hypothetical protein